MTAGRSRRERSTRSASAEAAQVEVGLPPSLAAHIPPELTDRYTILEVIQVSKHRVIKAEMT